MSIIPPKGGSGTAPPKQGQNTATIDVAELARLRAIEEAATAWASSEGKDLGDVCDNLLRLMESTMSHDSPPSPLPTDEQISRLLKENEVLSNAMAKIVPETTLIQRKAEEICHAARRIFACASPHYLKMAMDAK